MHKITGRVQYVRELNRSTIIDVIRKNQPISQASIAKETGLNPSTVSNIITELKETGLVRETGTGESTGGRRPCLLQLNARAFYAVGVEVGDTQFLAVVVDLEGNPVYQAKVIRRPQMKGDEALAAVADLVQKTIAKSGVSTSKLLGVGLGIAGLVDAERGISVFSPNLGWQDLRVREHLVQLVNMPVFIDNDVNAMALGECWLGAGKGKRNVVCVHVGYGLGAGLVLEGKIYRGTTGAAGEFGHTVVDLDGPRCECGNHGCLEVMAAGCAVESRAVRAHLMGRETLISQLCGGKTDRITVKLVIEAARQGDPVALDILRQTGWYLGIGVANIVNSYDPELVILGGDVIEAGDLILHSVTEAAEQYAFVRRFDSSRIVTSQLGDKSQAIGASTIVLNELFDASGQLDLRALQVG